MSGYATAWWLVGAGGFLCVMFVGLLLRHSVRPALLWPALALLAAVLMVPAPHPGAEGVWVPAFLVAIFEGIFQPSGQITVALRLLLASCITALAVSGGIAGLWALRRRRSAKLAPPPDDPAAGSA